MNRLVIIICTVLLLNSCKNNKKEQQEEVSVKTENNMVTLTDAQYKNAGIEVGTIERQNISSKLKVNGKIDVPPKNKISVSVPLGGYLKYTKLLPGMPVSRGQVIAVIEDPQYIQIQQDYLVAKAQYAYNNSEYNRQKQLNVSKATSDKVYEQTKTNYQTQNILVKSLEQKLRLIGINPSNLTPNNISKTVNIYSPINGFVSLVNVNIGKYVNPTEVLFELVNPTDIHLALDVYEKDIDKLSIGQTVLAYTNTNPDMKYSTKIILISKNVSADNTVEVHCHFDNYDKELIPGMYMNADIEAQTSNTSALPNDAIVRFENKNYVFEVKGKNKFEMKEVKTGISENGFTEILQTDLEDKQFATKGAYNLLMSLKNTED
ncbi:efflux RND transporter periplasmic adaptor subunit [Elizabethkingia anophelis]|uniref:efflux RND transporter periplasmic adaptor subunit n=1 Tax=Elizabethkingia anophelis TaxID=1117645 RepID=UPI00248EA49E|nr:efflux RND transporter periplasmic adaptor subunit [Elizabethkingia anophelis]EJC8060761.1 efflux RND transporter periplasmic adaptor subunit [Elizabethkingia anophelis]MCT4121919.1 efflux RND transporter periplasmic adaptor subunit [Elizabethkingia anophelis]WBS70677.1 efflux RND transporter periplasmic adaptor subunit [Elizabethkingia anophelis]